MNLLLEASTTQTTNSSWNWNDFLGKCINWLQTSGLKLLIGLIVLFIAFFIVNAIAKGVKKSLEKHKRDKTTSSLLYKLIRYGLKIVLFIIFLGYVGIDTAGIGTIIASISVAIGLAVQGSLSNLAGWFVIIVMRPFRIGDYVEAQGQSGTVEDIRLFYTYFVSTDNKQIMIPNGSLANGNIINYSIKDLRRVDNVFQISYTDDAGKAISIIEKIIKNESLILKEPESFVKISCLGAHGVDITVRCWTKNEDYWTVYFKLISQVKEKFDESGITIPYEQLDVHVSSDKKD